MKSYTVIFLQHDIETIVAFNSEQQEKLKVFLQMTIAAENKIVYRYESSPSLVIARQLFKHLLGDEYEEKIQFSLTSTEEMLSSKPIIDVFWRDFAYNFQTILSDTPFSFDELAAKILADYYLPKNFQYHGAQHVSRVTCYMRMVINFLRAIGYPPALAMSPQTATILLIVSLTHDIGRKIDTGKDVWEAKSMKLCLKLISPLLASSELALFFSSLVNSYNNDQIPDSFEGQLLQSVDALDILRCKPLVLEKISLHNHLMQHDDRDLILHWYAFVNQIRTFISEQYDLACTSTILVDEVWISKRIPYQFDREKKKYYEQDSSCYQKIVTNFSDSKQLDLLAYYYNNNELMDYQKKISPPLVEINMYNDLPEISFIKVLRPEVLFKIEEGISTGKKYSIRIAPKKTYTMHETGIIRRSEKPSQYNPEEKKSYSKPQSCSIALPRQQIFPSLFTGFSNILNEPLIAILFDSTEQKPTRFYFYKAASVCRPDDSNSRVKLEKKYAIDVKSDRPCLFFKMMDYITALKQTVNTSKVTEVISRLKWTKNSRILIPDDTLESRLFAFAFAEEIHKKVQSCKLPRITYYLANPKAEKNFQEYDEAAFQEDKQIAENIFLDRDQRLAKYHKKQYQFLLALDNPQEALEEILSTGETILYRLLLDGAVVTLQFILTGKKIDIHTLSLGKGLISPQLLHSAAHIGNTQLVAWLIEQGSLPNDSILNIAVNNDDLDLVALLIEHMTVEIPNNFDEPSSLQEAIKKGYVEITNLLLSRCKLNAIKAEYLLLDAIENNYPDIKNLFVALFQIIITFSKPANMINALEKLLSWSINYGNLTALETITSSPYFIQSLISDTTLKRFIGISVREGYLAITEFLEDTFVPRLSLT